MSDVARAQPRWPWVTLTGAYLLVMLLLRVDLLWFGDPDQIYRKGWVFALLGGVLQDAAVAAVLAGVGSAIGTWGWRVVRGLLALLVAIAAANLAVLSGMNVPADLIMLTYVADPFTAGDVESPVAPGPMILRLAVATAGLLLATRRCHALARSWRWAGIGIGTGALLWPAAGWVADRDHRSRQVSHADGPSWLRGQLSGRPFRLLPGTDLRAALLGPAAVAGDGFASEDYPLVRGSPHQLCRLGIRQQGCDRDQDGDGAALRVDCDDARHDVHPGAEDPPGDRLDQDCSGIDAEPPDVLVIQLESLPARVLQRTGGRGDDLVAPRLAELAARADARLFTRYETAGVQTAPGFASAMCSILPNFGASLTRAHPNVRLRCLPAVLRERGYETRMVQNGNPDFDRQGVFAERIGFSRVEGMADIARATGDARQASKWGLLDEILFRRLAQILADRRPSDPPLLLLAQSINNHHPYAVDDPRFARFDPEGSIWDKVRNCSGYVDSALGDLVTTLDGLARLPARRPLLVVISGDHGHGTGIHPGNVMPTSGLFAENVHTPLVWWMPNHPDRMRGLDSAGFDDPASSADLMPTVLGLLGVHTLHASMGRDLARVAQDRDRRAISENPLAGGLIRIRRPDHVVVTRAVPPGIWWFDASDLDEQVDRSNDRAEAARRGADEAIGAVMAATDLIRRDRVWNDGLLRQP